MVGQADSDREGRRAAIGCFKLDPPPLQFILRVTSSRGLIDCIVDLLTEGLDRVHRSALLFRKKEEGVIEVAPALFGESRAIGLRVSGGE